MALEKSDDEVVSEFPSVRNKKSRVISLQEYYNIICSDTFKERVQQYRQLKSQPGHEAEAQSIKDNLPCIIPAGVCQGGHAVKNLTRHSGILCIDLDIDHPGSHTEEVFELTKTLAYVRVSHRSVSLGVKVMVRVSLEDVERDYQRLYAAIGSAVSKHVQHPYDAKCKILTQPCFYSWDPEAYYNPDATVFEMAWDETESQATTATEVQDNQPPTAPAPNATADVSASAPGFVAQFVSDFEHRNPFVRGERNDLALKLGRVARSKGFSASELEDIIALFSHHYAAADFTNADIHQRICAGYQYVERNLPKESKSTQGSNKVQILMGPQTCADDEESEDEVLEKNNELRAAAPHIPHEVYKHLPQLLQDCVKYATSDRDRDLLLLGSLNSCSAALPYVSFQYKNALYSPHFYLAAVASAGAGKGVLAYTTVLLDPVQEYYEQENRKKKKEWEQKMLEWETECHRAVREKRNPDLALKPEEYKGQHLKLAASTSKSRLIEHLVASKEIGCCMCSSEISTLSTSLKQECGDYADIFCKAAQHEEVSLSYKNSGEPIVVRTPRLALNMSGTQEQFLGFFRSSENGLTSRFATYVREAAAEWESCAPSADGIELRKYFRTLGKELLEMHKVLLEFPTLVTFTPEQWLLHTERFSRWLNSAVVEGAETAQAIVFRHGVLAMRLAAVLTTFRKWDDYRYAKEYTCTDEDFNTALQIVSTLLEHSLLLSTSLPKTIFKPRRMHPYHRFEKILSHLKRRFSYTDYMKAADEESIPEATAKRLLKKGVETHFIVKEKDTYRKKKKVPTK